MAHSSRRVLGITGGGADGWEVVRASKALIRSGTPVIELTVGEHDVKTDPILLDAMARSARSGHTGYSEIPGLEELRAGIAARAERITGVPTGSENVVVTAGGQGALFAAHMLAGDAGDRALYVEPY